jgi:hypothetical protein
LKVEKINFEKSDKIKKERKRERGRDKERD